MSVDGESMYKRSAVIRAVRKKCRGEERQPEHVPQVEFELRTDCQMNEPE